MSKWTRLIFLAVLGLTTALSPAVSTVSAQSAKKLTTATVASDPHIIDPQLASDQRDSDLSNILFPGLTFFNQDTGLAGPGLATAWDVSADGLVYTFHLLKNVPWVHYNADSGAVEKVMDDKGNPRYVTANDVVYGWTRALDPATAATGAYMLAPVVAGGEKFNSGKGGSAKDLKFRAVDDFTFEVTAPEKVGYALGIFGIITARPVPQWAVEKGGTA